jgi:alkylation response protein AidB-like acyl-CoA dehydrogenase
VAVRDVFVPTDWTLGADKGMPGVPAPATRGLPTNSVATLGLAGVPLGIARGALDGFRERLATKLRAASFRGAADQVGAQHRLGAAAAEVDAAGLLVLRDCDEMERSAAAGKSATKEQRGRYRRDAAFAFQTCAGAVARLLPAAGAHAIFRDGPLQRSLRDTQVMATHIVADWDQGRESYARALLDLPIEDPVF